MKGGPKWECHPQESHFGAQIDTQGLQNSTINFIFKFFLSICNDERFQICILSYNCYAIELFTRLLLM